MSQKPDARLALVTGASTGIGRAFAEALAARGADLILVARDTERLEELATRITQAHGRKAEVLTADLTRPGDLAAVEERLRHDGSIDLLVNNAGFGTNGNFCDLEVDAAQAQIDLNVTALVRLAHAAVSSLRSAGRGGVINISSGASFLPTPGSAIYAATKSFVTSFSQGLHAEVEDEGVTVTVVCPGFTRTEFQDRGGYDVGSLPAMAWQSAEDVVAESLAAYARGDVVCITGFQNRALIGAVRLLPPSLAAGLAKRFMPKPDA